MKEHNRISGGEEYKVKVLVTGGAGYLGSTLIPVLLQAGYQVRAVDSLLYGGNSLLSVWSHPGFEFLPGDIRDEQLLSRALSGVDHVVHLAAIVGDPACARQSKLARQVNLEASLSLLELSRQIEVKSFIFASTCSNYGRMKASMEYVDELSPLKPLSLYAESKVAVEKMILESFRSKEFPATILRFATLYGVSPRMRFDLTVNEFTMELVLKKHLVVFGEQFWRPYLHVRDAARAILLILQTNEKEKIHGEVFNVGSTSENYQKKELVNLILAIVPDAVVEVVHRDEDPRDYRVSFEKISSVLGFQVTVTVKSGICQIAKLLNSGVIADFSDPSYRN